MKKLFLNVTMFLFILGFSVHCVWAEVIFLKSGIKKQGKIIEYSNDFVTIELFEEDKIEKIPIANINLVTYERFTEKQFGIGYENMNKQKGAVDIYLRNGEVIEGKITQYTSEFVTVESISGHGHLQLPTVEISTITTKGHNIELNQREGIGYMQQKNTVSSSNSSYLSNMDQISYKFFMTRNTFGNILLSYANSDDDGQKLQVMGISYRLGRIFKKYQDTILYYGGSMGYLSVKDDENDIDGSGYSIRGFVGGEMFFKTLPNIGLAAEIGLGRTDLGSDYKATEVTHSSFPTFIIHYYF